MKFEKIIKNLSSCIAGTIVFFIAAGMYLSWKGFVMQPNGKLELMNQAQASMLNDQVDSDISEPIDSLIALSLPEKPILGSADAPLTLYEFSSFGCIHCADFHLNTLPLLYKSYIQTNRLKVIFVNFPLDKKSMQGAMIASCLPQENFYDYINTVFKNQREWGYSRNSAKILSQYAAHNGISQEKAQQCAQDTKIADNIISARQEAIERLKINGTPSFLLTGANFREIIHGAPNYASLKQLLDKKLLKINK